MQLVRFRHGGLKRLYEDRSAAAHGRQGDLKGFWSLTVTGNWRLVFRHDEEANSAADIDLIDYH